MRAGQGRVDHMIEAGRTGARQELEARERCCPGIETQRGS